MSFCLLTNCVFPGMSSTMLESVTSFKLVSNLISEVQLGSLAIVSSWLTGASNFFHLIAVSNMSCVFVRLGFKDTCDSLNFHHRELGK